MWRDPLDELVEDLERALPPAKPEQIGFGPSLMELQKAMQTVIYGRRGERLPRNEVAVPTESAQQKVEQSLANVDAADGTKQD